MGKLSRMLAGNRRLSRNTQAPSSPTYGMRWTDPRSGITKTYVPPGVWKVVSGGVADWDSITGKPSVFPPAPHTHDGLGLNVGYYDTAAALIAANPTGTAGQYGIVGETDSIWVWDDTTNSWVNSSDGGSSVFTAQNKDYTHPDFYYIGETDGKINRYTTGEPTIRTQATGLWADRYSLTYS